MLLENALELQMVNIETHFAFAILVRSQNISAYLEKIITILRLNVHGGYPDKVGVEQEKQFSSKIFVRYE